MGEWLPRRPVVPAKNTAAWRVKRNGKYVSKAQLDAEAAQRAAEAALRRDDNQREKAAARTQRLAELHDRGAPCGKGNCTILICAEAWEAKKEAKAAAKREQSRSTAPNKRTQGGRPSASSSIADRRRIELHAKGQPCGQPGCKEFECRRAQARRRPIPKPKPKLQSKAKKPKRVASAGVLPMGVTGNKSGSDRALERARAKHASKGKAVKSATGEDSTPSSTRTGQAPKAKKKQPAPSVGSKGSPKPKTLTCRECLRTKSVASFPDPGRRRCADCGGTPRSTSVRTVSGGAPGLGRRR